MRQAKPIWTPSLGFLAQSCHVGWGAFLLLALALHVPLWAAWLVGLPLAALKEFEIDPWLESDSLADGLLDFSFYVVGGILGSLVAWFS